MFFGKIVVFTSNTYLRFENSLKILKTHLNFWCHGVNNKHHAAKFHIPPLRSVMFAIKRDKYQIRTQAAILCTQSHTIRANI